MVLPATAERHQEHPAASYAEPVAPLFHERLVRFQDNSFATGTSSPDTVLTEVVYPLQNRLGGLANQLTAALLACVILAMIVFPASFRGTWKTALTKILFWLY